MIASYDPTLVVLSISVAIIGSFTGLLIVSRVSGHNGSSYKLKIAAGAAAIGSSIWSMHFIGMLALVAPVPLRYDGLITAISVFAAILLTGLGLYAASSGYIKRGALPAGGLLMGSGIAGMHYIGMSAIRATCTVSYAPFGVAAAIFVGIAASTLALWFAFRERGPLETAAGAVALGLAISAMHYSAMLATTFSRSEDIVFASGPVLSQHGVAFIVAIATFLICGLFLVIALPDKKSATGLAGIAGPAPPEAAQAKQGDPAMAKDCQGPVRIPVRRNHSTYFAAPGAILAVRAEGHYSWIALRSKDGGIDELFCERSISDLAKLLAGERFVRSHRSHLVNIEHVLGYKRQGDGGVLFLDEDGAVAVPVSRAKVQQVLQLLEGGMSGGLTVPDHAPA
ncbi:MAG: MHYT domain-containing protein [Rhodomicrobium sp.]